MEIFVYVYHSGLTERMIVSGDNHGKEWVMSDGEVYDLVSTINVSNGECGMITEDDFGCVTKGKEKDLA